MSSDIDKADVSSRADSVRGGDARPAPLNEHREPHDCAACAAVLAELMRFEATASDDSTDPEASVVLFQVVTCLRTLIDLAPVNPVPGQRWRSTKLPNVEARVVLVNATEVELGRYLRGELVGREYIVRSRFGDLMRRRGWSLVTESPSASREAPGCAVEDESDGIPPTLRAVGRGVFEGEFGEGGERRVGGAAVVVSDHDDGLPETDQGSRDDVAQQLGATGETLAVITGSEEA